MRLKLYIMLLFNLFANISTSLLYILGNIDGTKENSCSDSSRIFWNFAWTYFQDKKSVFILGINDTSIAFSNEIMECSMVDYQMPVRFYRRGENQTRTRPPHSVFSSRTTDGFIIISNSVNALKNRLKSISDRDRNSKIIFVLFNNGSSAQQILKTGWDSYKMLNLVVFSLSKTRNKNTAKSLLISIYNPFIINTENGENRGKLYTFNNKTLDPDLIFKIIHGRLLNVREYNLRICIFNNPGTVVPDIYGENNRTILKYKLQDGEIIDTLVKSINFRPEYYNPLDGVPYGHQLPNGTITGSLKEIDLGRADILANLRPVKDYGQQKSEFLFPVDQMDLAFLTPKMPTKTTVSFLEIFSWNSSIILASIYIIVVLIWKSLHMLHRKWFMDKTKRISFAEICLITFGDYLMSPQRAREMLFEKLLFSGWIFFSMINCFTYQATMVEHLTTSVLSLDLETMEQLAESGLKILTVTGFKELLKDIANAEGAADFYKLLYSRQELVDNPKESLRRVAYVKDSAFLYSLLGCRYNQLNTFSKDGKQLLHVLVNGPPKRYSAHMIPANSPYKDRFDFVLMKIRESGLMPKWRDDIYFELERKRLKKFSTQDMMEGKVYRMRDLWFIFTSWFLCCSLCFLVFIGEFFWKKFFGWRIRKWRAFRRKARKKFWMR